MKDSLFEKIQSYIIQRERLFGDNAYKQCPTVFKVSRHQCEGVYGHPNQCQDIGYPDQKSKDLEYKE